MSAEPDQTLPSHSPTILREVTPQDLFNLPLYEHHLVIDTRPPEDYAQGHIATAVSLPSPGLDCTEGERERLLVRFIGSYIKEFVRPENPSPIVLYGSTRPECLKHTEWLARKLEKLQRDRKAIATVKPSEREVVSSDEHYDPFEQFCHTIADRVQEIWILNGGYDAFQSEYDFLCGHVTFESMFPLPHQINPNVYLGSRVISLKKDILSKLGITHLIVSTSQKLEWHELQGVSVLQCDVGDKNDQDMFPCWKACVTFITEALSQRDQQEREGSVQDETGSLSIGGESARANVCVLVLLHGRSRSTSVILAYLIKTLKIGFEKAWTLVRKNCWHLIDRSLVYEEQLKEWEKYENRALTNQ